MILPLIFFIFLPIITGLIYYVAGNRTLRIIIVFFQLTLFVLSFKGIASLESGTEIISSVSSAKLPLGMALRYDMVSGMMIFLNNMLFFLMMLFNYKKKYSDRLFIFLFLSLQGLINGIFLSFDFFNVYVLIEVSTVIVSILIMYKKDSRAIYDGMIYFLLNSLAMCFFLLGIAFLYKYSGALDFGTIKIYAANLPNKKILALPMALLFTGITLKAAFIPLFSWLPRAHGTPSAPSVVSAVLSGIYVKTGIYLFVRMKEIFAGTLNFEIWFFAIGVFTAIAGLVFAVSHYDIKLILSYHTVSQLGFALMGISGGTGLCFLGGIFHIMNHGIFKALLFILAGVLVEKYETRNIYQMKGLWKSSKFISIALILAVLSITGAPLFNGYYSKHMIVSGIPGSWNNFIFMLINFGTMLSFVKFLMVIPGSRVNNNIKTAIGINQYTALAILVVFCAGFGLFGDYFSDRVLCAGISYGMFSQIYSVPLFILKYSAVFLLYGTVFKNMKSFKKIRQLEISFNQNCFMITGFFFATFMFLAAV